MKHTLSRREFLAAATASAGLLGIETVQADTRAESLKRFGGFHFGIQAHGLRHFPMDEAIRIIHEDLKLHWVEFSKKHIGPGASSEEIRRVRGLLDQSDMTCTAVGVHGFKGDAAANRKTFEFAKAMGAHTISANPTQDAFNSLEKLVEEFGIRIAIHNHGPDALYDKIADVTNAIQGRHPSIGACIDTAHFIRSKQDPIEAIYKLKGRVFGVHVKDVAKQVKKTHDVIIGKGFLDVEAMFKALKAVGFPEDGALSLEFEGNPDNPVAEIKQCVAVASQAARKVAHF